MQNLMPPVNTPDKLFHDGDPTQGIEGTIVYAEHMNNQQGAIRDLQQEVINVLKEAGLTPSTQKQNQLVEALSLLIGNKVPGALLTQKGIVQLNSAVNSESEEEAATPRAVKIAMDNANARLAKDRNGSDIPNKPLFLDNISGVPKTRKVNGMALSSDITISNISGNAGTATRLQSARMINGVAFDGTHDININTTDYGAVRNFQYTNEVFHNPGSNMVSWTFRAPSGCVLSGIQVQDTGRSSADNIAGVYYKSAQIYINGAWRTVSG
ncbi:phage tail protein [Escherichia coli]|uniref:phage tail protein n=1 Tax=Escherichia coli TaxID=562 RepID=UPI0019E1DBCD|nr:phage tail protein [Escherichia coli]EGI3991305.1 phage tail protein [Escherichia coli]EGI4001671.1 phage tail protein [Escherichia coli]EGI4009066.1 phage tail protein [Escherichia coli]EGI4021299.1 phage tail protein [Escherichia coli]EGI4028708.1 phage tail protein [Escherichia coli]